jgi:7,8-dihydroneopterin aldolase/epimerase/oxygenase
MSPSSELELMASCRRLFLRDHEVMVRIGAHDFEQDAPQRVLINVELFVPLADTSSANDELADVVDYDFIREAVAERIARGHIQLQETLVDDLLAKLLGHPQVRAAKVSSEKPDVYPDCAAVGVEVFGFKASVSP